MSKEFMLVNVVFYDGQDAFVSKFVLATKDGELTMASRKRVKEYMAGNGEILKIDPQYAVTIDNIMAYKENPDMAHVFDRWVKMYI